MKNRFKKLTQKILALTTIIQTKVAMASLPTSSKYSTSDGDYSSVISSAFSDGYSVGVAIFGALVFVVTGYAAIAAFMEYRKGQKELGEVGIIAAIGGVIVSLCFYYLNQGTSVLS